MLVYEATSARQWASFRVVSWGTWMWDCDESFDAAVHASSWWELERAARVRSTLVGVFSCVSGEAFDFCALDDREVG